MNDTAHTHMFRATFAPETNNPSRIREHVQVSLAVRRELGRIVAEFPAASTMYK